MRAGSAGVKHYQGTVNSLSKLNIDFSAPAVLYHSVHLKAVWIVSLDGAKMVGATKKKKKEKKQNKYRKKAKRVIKKNKVFRFFLFAQQVLMLPGR